MATDRSARRVVAAVTALFGGVLVLWTLVTPVLAGPDEWKHFSSILRLTAGAGWPDPGQAGILQTVHGVLHELNLAAPERSTLGELWGGTTQSSSVDQMTQHPPTYYLLGAGVLQVLGLEALRWDHAVVALRLLDSALLLPIPALLFSTTRMLTRSRRAGLVSLAGLFLVPQFAHIGSAITNDALAFLLGAVVVWLTTRVLLARRRPLDVALLGAALGAFLLTKGTALPAVPFVLLALLAPIGPTRALRRIVEAAGALGVAFVVGGWWWARNLLVYGSVQPRGLSEARPEVPWPAGTGPRFDSYTEWTWDSVTTSFWGQFGLLEFPISPIVVQFLSVGCVLLLAGWAFRAPGMRRAAVVLGTYPVLLLVMQSTITWGSYVRTHIPYGSQGRYLYVAITALIALAALAAMQVATTRRARVRGAVVLVAGGAVMTVYGFAVAIGGFYTDPDRVGPGASVPGALAALSPYGAPGLAAAGLVTITACVWVAIEARRARGARVPT